MSMDLQTMEGVRLARKAIELLKLEARYRCGFQQQMHWGSEKAK